MKRKEITANYQKFEIRSTGEAKPVGRTNRSPEDLARMKALEVYNDLAENVSKKTNPISPQKRGLVRSAARQVVPGMTPENCTIAN